MRNTMKKSAILLGMILLLSSCYEDYVKDYDYNAVYFAYQTDVRTVVVGEGMKFGVGITLAGVIDNEQDRVVQFKTDNGLVNGSALQSMKNHDFTYIKDMMTSVTSLQELPTDEYSLLFDGKFSNEVIIRKGSHTAFINIKVDSLKFLSNTSRTVPSDVIPLTITKADADLIYDGKESAVIGVRYENMLFGNYWHGGKATVKNNSGTTVEELKYDTTIPQPDTRAWTLKTTAPFELTTNAVGGELNSSTPQFKIIQGKDGKVTVASVDGATYQVIPDGESSFNRAKLLQDRKIFLKYKYEKNGLIYHATDTLTFRNRIRDGVNEWQDENQNNYQ